ncbi:MAG: glycoside hydrolase family 3 C-terminal domain-containing protein [Gemmatimonadetes bacterium]|nr:glycoside hydrolase family 3 C-terminal domain-containing protein [Gemmatimonadota bacterium]
MTLEEKVGQLAQYTGQWVQDHPEVTAEHLALVRQGRVGSFLNVYGAAYTREVQRIAVEESRLGIPLLFAHDVIHGFRTIFPVPLAQAASWDPETVRRAARAAAVEGTAHGIHWTFAPMVDIARDPRWGRVVEGAGEDPFLGSAIATALVRGFQGDRPDSLLMLATAKHFVAYGAAQAGRDYNSVDISERALREVYLPPFHAAVRAGAWSVMGGFNAIAGVPMHAHRRLLRDVLRGEWGFGGILVSDYTAVREMEAHGVAGSETDAGALALTAGVDVDMVSGIFQQQLPALVRAARVPERLVDEAARGVLRAKAALGLFDNPYRYTDPAHELAATLTRDHVALARELARKSIVLLKNQGGVLPLRNDLGRIAVIGPLADDSASALGAWAAAGRPADVVTILEGIRRAVSPETRVTYVRGAAVEGLDTSGFGAAVQAARNAQAVLLVLGEHRDMSGEAASRSTLDLPGVQEQLARVVLAQGKPTVVVLANGRPLTIPWLAAQAPAILETWYLGVQMGPAVADVLFGDYNPGGKLPISFPRALGQVPIQYSHENTGRPPGDDKYTSKYLDVPVTPLYPFGYGLSYTTFAHQRLSLDPTVMGPADTLVITVDVTNTGSRAGDEVTQLYVRDEVASVAQPVRVLRGFQRNHLAPRETRKVTFRLGAQDLAFWGLDQKWVVEPGWFTVYVGPSSAEGLETRFQVRATPP